MSKSNIIFLSFLLMLLAGCQGSDKTPIGPLLTGRAILPADTFGDGPAVGHELDSKINGRDLPFSSVPIQGFSSLVKNINGSFMALQDNGFGTLANSPRYPLRWYRLQIDLEGNKPHGGSVSILETVTLSDPDHWLDFPLAQSDTTRVLHGADFDPESFVRLPDGTFWVGEEFGPCLLHFAASGKLLAAPTPIPVAPPLRPHGHGSYFLRSPDHPDLRFGKTSQPDDQLANISRSGGIEGLAHNLGGTYLYVAVEKPMLDDPRQNRRAILEFNPAQNRFTSRFWFYRADTEEAGITSLEGFSNQVFLVLERDSAEGTEASLKRVYRVDLDEVDDDGYLEKTLICDLLHIRDNLGFSAAEEGAVGLGPDYSFPYITPESLVILDAETLLFCNDNNFPLSSGRRPPHTPDDNEFIRLQLPKPIKP